MKKLQKLFATLLAVCMVMSMLSVNAFAAEKTSAIQIVEDGGMVYYLADPQEGEVAGPTNFDVWTSKTIAGTSNEDEFVVTLQVGTTMKAIPNDVAVVLVMDASGSMMSDAAGTIWGYEGALPTDGRKLRIDYAREAALEFATALAENSGGAQRMLSIVEFGNNALTVLPWTDANDNGTLRPSVAEAISSVDVNFVVDNQSFWDEDWIESTDIQLAWFVGGEWKDLKVENWSDEEYTHETQNFFEAKFASYFQSFMTEYISTMVTETVEEAEVTRCTYPDCEDESVHTHCSVEGCTNSENHSHCTYDGCTSTEVDHTHCTYDGCQSAVANHRHCAVCGVSDADKPDDTHCTYEECEVTEAHKHCTYSICSNPAGHKHCDRRYYCAVAHNTHCWDIQAVCGEVIDETNANTHKHVVGCTVDGCQDTTPDHKHGCVHSAVTNGKTYTYPFYNYKGGNTGGQAYLLSSVRCLNSDPEHTHDVYDGDSSSYYMILDRVHQKNRSCGTNLEGGLMLARNLVNAGKADGTLKGINDVYVVLLSDGNPTYHVNQSLVQNPDTRTSYVFGERGGGNYAEWADVADIVFDGNEGDIAIAEDIKAVADLYAILYGTSLGTKLGGNHAVSNVTGKDWFETKNDPDIGKYNYVGADAVFDSPEADELNTVFADIKNRIDILAKAWTVSDELSDDVTFLNFVENGAYAGFTPASGDKNAAVSWSLGNMTPESGDGSMSNPYIYTLKYKVKLNSAQDNVKATSLAHDADTSLDGIWTGTNTKLQYFMIDKEQLDKMTPDQIEAKLRAAAFEDLSVKGIYGDYEFIKKDKETDGVIEGVGFTLYDASGKAYGSEVFSDSEGKVVFTDIPRGDYTLKETTVPDGMQQMSDLDSRISWGEITAVNGGEMPDVIYNWPVGAEIPDGGGTGNPGGNDGGEGGSTPSGPSNPSGPSKPTTPSVPTEEIEEEDVPLGDLPTGDDVEIGEEDVPLTALPDEEPPLAMAPATGDVSALWLALSALSGTGLAGVSLLGRKKRDEE